MGLVAVRIYPCKMAGFTFPPSSNKRNIMEQQPESLTPGFAPGPNYTHSQTIHLVHPALATAAELRAFTGGRKLPPVEIDTAALARAAAVESPESLRRDAIVARQVAEEIGVLAPLCTPRATPRDVRLACEAVNRTLCSWLGLRPVDAAGKYIADFDAPEPDNPRAVDALTELAVQYVALRLVKRGHPCFRFKGEGNFVGRALTLLGLDEWLVGLAGFERLARENLTGDLDVRAAARAAVDALQSVSLADGIEPLRLVEVKAEVAAVLRQMQRDADAGKPPVGAPEMVDEFARTALIVAAAHATAPDSDAPYAMVTRHGVRIHPWGDYLTEEATAKTFDREGYDYEYHQRMLRLEDDGDTPLEPGEMKHLESELACLDATGRYEE